jgi:hypothetical protein
MIFSAFDYFVGGAVLGLILGVYAHRVRILGAFRVLAAERDAFLAERDALKHIVENMGREAQELRAKLPIGKRAARRVAKKRRA